MKPFDPDARHPGPKIHFIEPETMQAPPKKGGFMRLVNNLMRTRIDKSTHRIRIVAFGFVALYCVIGGKLVYLGMKPEPQSLRRAASEAVSRPRPDLVDRNGEILATDIKVMSVFAEPRRIIDKDEAVELLTARRDSLHQAHHETMEALGRMVWESQRSEIGRAHV